ncbi:MAG: nuclear transport factor 2 family protein [Dehalococcoidia bacterium]
MTSDTSLAAVQTDDAAATLDAIARFNAAFGQHDVDGIMAMMTDDCIFEDTPPPDGQRYSGSATVRAYWEQFFRESPFAHFDAEECFASDDRCIVRWRYSWEEHGAGHVRGIDLFRVRDGKVAEKLAYVKG